MGGRLDDQVVALLDLLPRWARRRRDIRAVALVGSRATGASRPDSDVDLVVLTEEPDRYIREDDWIGELGGVVAPATRPWGAITERRFALAGGLEVEVGVGRPSWASVTPLDAGTRRVADDGLVALYDPDRLLAKLLERPRPARG